VSDELRPPSIPEGYEYLCEADLPVGAMRRLKVGEYGICLSNVGGDYYAIEDACNHSGASLVKGRLDGTLVTCFLHAFSFDVRTGRLVTRPRLCEDQPVFALLRVGSAIYIDRRSR
jgi:nitrite reductase/ring-hydroxylating ferredoxin subunit